MKDEKFVEQQRIKNAYAVPLWDEVRVRIRAHVSALNSHSDILLIQKDQPDGMAVRDQTDGGRVLNAAFNKATGKLSWGCGQQAQEGWAIAVKQDGSAGFVWCLEEPYSPDHIATKMLDTLLMI